MPIIWKYLLTRFFRILILCLIGCVALLLVMRLDTITTFAIRSGHPSATLLFILYQIPRILPITLPISCLIASMLTTWSFSERCELTALRAVGLSIRQIALPLIIASLFLTLLNFYIASELTPACRSKARQLAHATTIDNPLFLLQQSNRLRFHDMDIDMHLIKPRQHAKNLTLVTYLPQHQRLALMTASDLKLIDGQLHAHHLTTLAGLPTPTGPDNLLLENTQSTLLPSNDLIQVLKRDEGQPPFDSLSYRLMHLKSQQESHKTKTRARFQFEILRRLSYALAPITFTLIGLAFGIQIGRRQHKKPLFLGGLLATLLITSILIGKSFETNIPIALALYALPHPIGWLLSARHIRFKQQGVE